MYLLVTVDAEAVHGRSPLDELMWGRLKGFEGEYGIGRIADICERHNIQATFFLDVYEHAYYSRDALRQIATYLDRRGHSVQLHTHPAWYQDKRDWPHIRRMKKERSCFPADKYWMNLNSLEEQVTILKHGQDLLQEWLGKPVKAHRAGAYALDMNTIHALREVGIPIDSSMFYGHPHSRVTWSANLPVKAHGVLEIPITVFQRRERWDWGFYKQDKGTRYVKTDIDWCSLDELRQFVQAGRQHQLPVVNLFLHSYSLLKSDYHFTRLAPNPAAIERLDRFLAFCASEQVRPVPVDELERSFKAGERPAATDDFVPVAEGTSTNIYRKAFQRALDKARYALSTFNEAAHA